MRKTTTNILSKELNMMNEEKEIIKEQISEEGEHIVPKKKNILVERHKEMCKKLFISIMKA